MMKTTEFVKKVEALGYEVHSGHQYIEIELNDEDVVDVLKTKRWVYDCEFEGFELLSEIKQTELMELVREYTSTRMVNREEEKWYRVKFPGIKRDGKNIYIMRTYNSDGTQGIDWSPEEYIFNDYPGAYLFTEKEIKSMNEHYWHFAEEVEG